MKYRKKNLINYILITFIIFFLINGCVKDNFNFDKWDKELSYNAGFALPIAYGEVAFIDVIKKFDEEVLFINNEFGFLSLVYNDNIRSKDVHDILSLPNQTINKSYDQNIFNFSNFLSPNDTVNYSLQRNIGFEVFNDDAELITIILNSANFYISTQSSFQHNAKLYLSFPSITKNGVPFKTTATINQGQVSNINKDLSNYTIDLSQTPQGYNEIPIDISITLINSGSGDNTGTVDFTIQINNIEYELIHGYFGKNTLIYESGKINITIFESDEISIEDYYFEDPRFKVFYKNSYGIPNSFYFKELLLSSTIDNLDYNITHYEDGLPMDSLNPYVVAFPTIIGNDAEDVLIVSKKHSNIGEIIDKRPKWVKFASVVHTNPDKKDYNNFITANSIFEAELQVELPLWGYIYNFYNYDTIDFKMVDVYDYDNWDPISSAFARVNIRNGFPIEVFANIKFVDENYNILDSLFHGDNLKIIEPANVDNNGKVNDFGTRAVLVELNENRLNNIKNTKHLIIGGFANTTNANNQKLVKIYEDYKISFDIGFEVDVSVDVNLDSINSNND